MSMSTRSWPGQADMVTDIRVEHWLPWEQRGVVVALEEKNCGGAAQTRRLWVEVENALHRWMMQLRRREDRGPAYLTYYPGELSPFSSPPARASS